MTDLVGPLASTGYWLKHAALIWQRELDRALAPLGLTGPQFSVLAGVSWLNRGSLPPTQQQVADFAGADRMMTSRLLTTLESRELITRTPDAADARLRRVTLTTAGGKMIDESTRRARQVDLDLFGTDVGLRDLLHARFSDI